MISVIICWPDSFDFPVFRKNLSALQEHVDEVIICFTEHGNHPLRGWFVENMYGCKFLAGEQATDYPGDWRSKATNLMIDHAKGDWILSLEQDFFIKDQTHFWEVVKAAMPKYDAIALFDEQRFHPAFLLFNRVALGKTTRDFSVMGEGKDHFWLFSDQIRGSCNYAALSALGLSLNIDWFHMAGLTENYFAPKPYYRLTDFHIYNETCKEITPMSEYWKTEMNRCTGRASEEFTRIGDFL